MWLSGCELLSPVLGLSKSNCFLLWDPHRIRDDIWDEYCFQLGWTALCVSTFKVHKYQNKEIPKPLKLSHSNVWYPIRVTYGTQTTRHEGRERLGVVRGKSVTAHQFRQYCHKIFLLLETLLSQPYGVYCRRQNEKKTESINHTLMTSLCPCFSYRSAVCRSCLWIMR